MAMLCDYCGERLTGKFESLAAGHNNGYLRGECSADRWFYYCEGECLKAIHRVLDDISRGANLDEGSGYVWRLDRLPKTQEAAAKQTTAPKPRPEPVEGSQLLRDLELTSQKALNSLSGAGVRTLEEASQHCELELATLDGVGVTTMRRLAQAIEKVGLSFLPGPTSEDLGERIRDYRERLGLSRDDLARLIDPPDPDHDYRRALKIYGSVIADWEAARRLPNREHLELLAKGLQVSFGDLVPVPEDESSRGKTA